MPSLAITCIMEQRHARPETLYAPSPARLRTPFMFRVAWHVAGRVPNAHTDGQLESSLNRGSCYKMCSWCASPPLPPPNKFPLLEALGSRLKRRDASWCDKFSCPVMSAVHSESLFFQRAAQCGLSESSIAKLEEKNWRTYAQFAFSSSYVPGQGNDSDFVTKVAAVVLGRGDHPGLPKLRYLHYEVYSLAAQEICLRLEDKHDDQPRKIPLPERASRLKRLSERLPGLRMDGPSEPAHSLVDTLVHMLAQGSLRYVPWHECISREDEINGKKKAKEFRLTSQGTMVEQHFSDLRADTSTELRVMQCLDRHGIACDLAGLMRFEDRDLLVQLFMEELQRTPLPGCNHVTLEQLQQADREVWKLISKDTTSGLEAEADGTLPAARALRKAIDHASVRFLLMPLPAAPRQQLPKRSGDEVSRNAPGSSAKPKKVARRNTRPARRPPQLPQGLSGTPSTPDGAAICFSYNLGTCAAKNSKGCSRGRLVCTKCYKEHAYSACPNK